MNYQSVANERIGIRFREIVHGFVAIVFDRFDRGFGFREIRSTPVAVESVAESVGFVIEQESDLLLERDECRARNDEFVLGLHVVLGRSAVAVRQLPCSGIAAVLVDGTLDTEIQQESLDIAKQVTVRTR